MSSQDKFAGKAKEVAGKATGDEELESEGRTQNIKGKVQEKAEQARDSVKGAADAAKDAISGDKNER